MSEAKLLRQLFGETHPSLESLYARQASHIAGAIVNSDSHPIRPLNSGRWSKKWDGTSFVPAAAGAWQNTWCVCGNLSC